MADFTCVDSDRDIQHSVVGRIEVSAPSVTLTVKKEIEDQDKWMGGVTGQGDIQYSCPVKAEVQVKEEPLELIGNNVPTVPVESSQPQKILKQNHFTYFDPISGRLRLSKTLTDVEVRPMPSSTSSLVRFRKRKSGTRIHQAAEKGPVICASGVDAESDRVMPVEATSMEQSLPSSEINTASNPITRYSEVKTVDSNKDNPMHTVDSCSSGFIVEKSTAPLHRIADKVNTALINETFKAQEDPTGGMMSYVDNEPSVSRSSEGETLDSSEEDKLCDNEESRNVSHPEMVINPRTEGLRLTFEQRKWVLKCYWKFENVSEVQRQWKAAFRTDPPTRLTISRIRDKFEMDGTVRDVHKQRSGRRRGSPCPDITPEELLELFNDSSKSVKQLARETGISRSTVYRILKRAD